MFTARAARAQGVPPADTTARDSMRRAADDSLAARLARAEAALALIRQQMATESESAVRLRSRFAFELSARGIVNAFATTSRVNAVDVPQFVLPPTERRDDVVGLSIRQTQVGAAITVRDVAGATFDGDVDLDFYSGGYDSSGTRVASTPVPRLRTARAWLRWPHTAVMVGADEPLISSLSPASVAAVGVPGFAAAGNLWNWLPQVRVSRDLFTTGVHWAVQGAVLDPTSEGSYGAAYAAGGGGRSRRPFVEARLRARWGPEDPDGAPGADVRDAAIAEGPSEIGVGVHRGWVLGADASGVEHTYASEAVAMDARVVLMPRVELRVEAYRGYLLAGLGGGAIGQAYGAYAIDPSSGRYSPAAPLHDTAGWAQLNVRASESLVAGAGCGVDAVRDADRPLRRRNSVCAAHAQWRPAQPLLLGLEYRRLTTLYREGNAVADHVNLTLGIEL